MAHNKKTLRFISLDFIYLILGFVDLHTLRKCSEVCKSWNSLIKTKEFRYFWCSTSSCKEPFYITTSVTTSGYKESFDITTSGPNNQHDHYCWNWNTSTGHFFRFRLPPIHKKFSHSSIVASAGGLLCLNLQSGNNFKLVQLLVGNPITGLWKELPLLTWRLDRECGYRWKDFRMVTYEGGFKVCMQVLVPRLQYHLCYIYDTATNTWVSSRLPYSEAYIKAVQDRRDENGDLMPMKFLNAFYYDLTIVMFYDMMRSEWSTGKVRSLKITTGFEEIDGEKKTCVLYLDACVFRMWEYKGEDYFASPWLFAGDWAELRDEAGVDGFGVWRVDQEGCLVLVSARHETPGFYEELGFKGVEYMSIVQTEANGNLVCFSDQFGSPLVSYNLDTGCWVGFGEREGICFGMPCDRHVSEVEAHSRRRSSGYLYKPSLLPL